MAIQRNVTTLVDRDFGVDESFPYAAALRDLAKRYDSDPNTVSRQEYNLLVSFKNMEMSDRKLAQAIESNSVNPDAFAANNERHDKFLDRFNQYLEKQEMKPPLPPLTRENLRAMQDAPVAAPPLPPEPKAAQAPPLPPEPVAAQAPQLPPDPVVFQAPPLPADPVAVQAPPLPPEPAPAVPKAHVQAAPPPVPELSDDQKMAQKMDRVAMELDNLANLDTPLPNEQKNAAGPDLEDPIAALRGMGITELRQEVDALQAKTSNHQDAAANLNNMRSAVNDVLADLQKDDSDDNMIAIPDVVSKAQMAKDIMMDAERELEARQEEWFDFDPSTITGAQPTSSTSLSNLESELKDRQTLETDRLIKGVATARAALDDAKQVFKEANQAAVNAGYPSLGADAKVQVQAEEVKQGPAAVVNVRQQREPLQSRDERKDRHNDNDDDDPDADVAFNPALADSTARVASNKSQESDDTKQEQVYQGSRSARLKGFASEFKDAQDDIKQKASGPASKNADEQKDEPPRPN